MFLQKTDLLAGVYPEIAARISRLSDETILLHCATAETEIEAHLLARYAIRDELDKQGPAERGTDQQLAADPRHKLLLQIGRSIAIWYLYQPLETIPDKVEKAYERAAKLLQMLASGEIKLPGVAPAPVVTTESPGSEIAWGSTLRRTNYY